MPTKSLISLAAALKVARVSGAFVVGLLKLTLQLNVAVVPPFVLEYTSVVTGPRELVMTLLISSAAASTADFAARFPLKKFPLSYV
jgi:hypothetical protein